MVIVLQWSDSLRPFAHNTYYLHINGREGAARRVQAPGERRIAGPEVKEDIVIAILQH